MLYTTYMTSTKLLSLGLILAAVILEAIADISFKQWSLTKNNALVGAGFLIYMIGTVFWIISLRYEGLAKAISLFTVLNLIVIAGVGILLFKEHLSLVNKLGIGFGIISVILLEL